MNLDSCPVDWDSDSHPVDSDSHLVDSDSSMCPAESSQHLPKQMSTFKSHNEQLEKVVKFCNIKLKESQKVSKRDKHGM